MMSESPRSTASPRRKSSLASIISHFGSAGSSPELSSDTLPRFVSTSSNRESPNTTPGSSPGLSSFPHFVSPFKRGDPIDLGPASPANIASAPSRKHSITFTRDHQRKVSVASFHGDLKAKQTRKTRSKFLLKILLWSTLFLVGLSSGIAIGHWGIPYGNQPFTIAPTTAIGSVNTVAKLVTTPTSYWQPVSGTTFQIQLNQAITSTKNLSTTIQVFDVDLFDTPASIISGLKGAGKKVICYFSAGTAENWRSDYKNFQAADLGANMAGWAGEKWVHTPNANVRAIMVARLQLAKTKGCDGVDPDNVDVYSYGSSSGFSDLTQATAIDYLTFLAGQAHGMGLAIGLKNAGEIIPSIQPLMQWVVTEQCADYDECDIYTPFTNAGKAVFNIQYPFASNNKKTTVTSKMISKYCTGDSNVIGFTNIMKHMNLDSWLYQC